MPDLTWAKPEHLELAVVAVGLTKHLAKFCDCTIEAVDVTDVRVGDLLFGFEVTGVANAMHGGHPARRFTLWDRMLDRDNGDNEFGRVVLANDGRVYVVRTENKPTPEPAVKTTLDVVVEAPSTLDEIMAELVGGTDVTWELVHEHGPAGGHPVVLVTAPKDSPWQLLDVLMRYNGGDTTAAAEMFAGRW